MSTESFPVERRGASPELPATSRAGELLLALGARATTAAGAALVVGLLTALSLWFRTRAIDAHFWVDEGLSVGIAQHPLSAIPGLLRQDGSPPLYYMLLHVWISVFGSGEGATHALSLLFATLCIPAAYWAGASLLDRRAGLIGAGLAAGLPFLTSYAQETRMYALLTLLSLLLAATFVHVFVLRRRAYLPAFVLATVAALYTHNWALFLAAMAAAAFLVCVREAPADERRSLWRDGLIAFGAIAVLYLPWVPTLLYTARHTGAPWSLPPVVWSVTQSLYTIAGGRGVAVALLLGGGGGMLALLAITGRDGDAAAAVPRSATIVKALLILGAGTLLLGFVYSKTTPAWALRYLAVIVGPLLVAFTLGLARGGRVAVAALTLVAIFWILDPVPTKSYWKSNVALAVAQVRPHVGADPLVLSTQPEQTPTIRYYLHRPARYGSPLGINRDPRMLDWRDALSRFRRATLATTLVPMLDTVPVGGRVLLITPLRFPKQPQWMLLIKRASQRWSAYLRHDRSFRLIVSKQPYQYSTGLPVQASVFVRLTR